MKRLLFKSLIRNFSVIKIERGVASFCAIYLKREFGF